MKNQRGFTLIELMVVIAIVGILSAIAMPAYMDYTARAQAVEPLKVSGGLQANVSVFYWENGFFPPAGHDIINDALLLEGKYIAAGNLSVTPGTGAIAAVFSSGANAGQTMTITPTVNSSGGKHIIQWTCTGLAKDSHLPSGCR